MSCCILTLPLMAFSLFQSAQSKLWKAFFLSSYVSHMQSVLWSSLFHIFQDFTWPFALRINWPIRMLLASTAWTFPWTSDIAPGYWPPAGVNVLNNDLIVVTKASRLQMVLFLLGIVSALHGEQVGPTCQHMHLLIHATSRVGRWLCFWQKSAQMLGSWREVYSGWFFSFANVLAWDSAKAFRPVLGQSR